VPVPPKLTVCGLPGSLSLIARVAGRAPAALGLNARLIVQEALAGTLPAQLLVSPKSALGVGPQLLTTFIFNNIPGING
jgi:hypothetical protein